MSNQTAFPEHVKSPAGNPMSNSWVVENLATGKPECETFSRPYAERIHHYHSGDYRVWTAYGWLVELNNRINGGAP